MTPHLPQIGLMNYLVDGTERHSGEIESKVPATHSHIRLVSSLSIPLSFSAFGYLCRTFCLLQHLTLCD